MKNSTSTLGEIMRHGQAHLYDAAIEKPELDARLLLQHVCELDHVQLISRSNEQIEDALLVKYEQLIERRCYGEPTHRIIGKREFYGRSFKLCAETLEPRPDTETLIDEVLEVFSDQTGLLRFLDLGTGSGIIAITLCCEMPNVTVLATDISQSALDMARENAIAFGVSDRIEFLLADGLKGVEGRFDAIVSNPPYIKTSDIEGLSRDVREHDPLRALDGGADGLDFYREIYANALNLLGSEGKVVVEFGENQYDEVEGILLEYEGAVLSRRKDLLGIIRVLTSNHSKMTL